MSIDWQPLVSAIAGFIVIVGPALAALLIAMAAHRKASAVQGQVRVNTVRLSQVQRDLNGGGDALAGRVAALERRASASDNRGAAG